MTWNDDRAADGSTASWVERVEQEARARLEQAHALQEGLAAARGTGTSTDRSVTATVGASGVLTDVQFTVNATRLSPDALRDAVLEAVGRAQLDAADVVARLTEGMPGAADVRDLVAGRVPESTRAALASELRARGVDVP